MFPAALVVVSLLAVGSPACADDEGAWKGRCMSRYEWAPDDPGCPAGVIVIPEGENAPQCVPCETYEGMQQPMNYCAGMRAAKADAEMKASFDDLVRRLPAREEELRKAQGAWVKKRDAICRRKGAPYEGGSLQPQIENECLLERNRKRRDELARMAADASGGAVPPTSAKTDEQTTAASMNGRCGGAPTGHVPHDRLAWVIVDKSHFQDEPKICPADGTCPWRRKAYVVRGDEVLETASSHDFACVTYKATTGWLPLHDLCPADSAACAPKSRVSR